MFWGSQMLYVDFQLHKGSVPQPLLDQRSTILGFQLMNTFTQMQVDPSHLHMPTHVLEAHGSPDVHRLFVTSTVHSCTLRWRQAGHAPLSSHTPLHGVVQTCMCK